jgi:hypothetical protein
MMTTLSHRKMEFGSSTKNVALQGRHDKAHCCGTGSNFAQFFSLLCQITFLNASELSQKKTVCHARVLEDSNQHDLPLTFSEP